MRLTYETIVEAPQTAIDQIAQFLQINDKCVIDITKISLQVQSDTISQEWRERYLAESKNLNEVPKVGRSFGDALSSFFAKL